MLPVGAAVLLAVGESQKADAAPALSKNNPTPPPASGLATLAVPKQEIISAHYNIQKGDTISHIAKWFGISQREIERANPGLDPSKLHVGQTLFLPGLRSGFHVINKGENLTTIAKKHGISIEALSGANPGLDPRKLQLGTLLKVPAEKQKALSQNLAQPTVQTPTPQRVTSPAMLPKPASSSPTLTVPAPQAPTNNAATAMRSTGFWAGLLELFNKEGGKTTNPNDRAHQGEVKMTNLGITPTAMRQHLLEQGVAKPTPDMIRNNLINLTTETAIPIYAAGYWKAEYQQLGPKLSFLVFDWGVNSHPVVAIKQLQKTLGLEQDGKIGSETLKKLHAYPEDQICKLYIERRKEFYRSIASARPEQQEFLKGWLARCDSALAYVMSEPFKRLNDLFERTPVNERSLAIPLLHGEKTLGWGVNEPALTRWLQENLIKAGWQVSLVDGRFGTEMTRLTKSFQAHYKIPTTPETSGKWGAMETRALMTLLASPTLARN